MSSRRRRQLEVESLSVSTPQRCHVVGVGGPGMSPLAYVLAGRGHSVSGSDMRDSEVLDQLRDHGIAVTVGHSPELVRDVDIVTFSTAIPDTNVELAEARRLGHIVCHRSEVLAALCRTTESVGVAGTHGKTTSSALLTHILTTAGRDPSCIIGATVHGLHTGARVGSGELFVLEADESDGTLDVLTFRHLLVTNIDVDHLDYFETFEAVQNCFVEAAQRTTGMVVVNADDHGSSSLRDAVRNRDHVLSFGYSDDADMRVTATQHTPEGQIVHVEFRGQSVACALPLRGDHNAMNCAGAIAMACALGVDFTQASRALETFGGVGRRFTERGMWNGALFVDDYAHLPAEIEAALAAARSHPQLTGRVVAVFQPNRFHRIAAMADSYAHCFQAADHVVVTDVYASGTARIDGVTGELVVNAIKKAHPDTEVVWAPHRSDIVRDVQAFVRAGDICVSMGCGDIETFPDDVMNGVSQ